MQGLDVRVVKHRDWHIDPADMERAVDRKTKLIAISLVSSVNGHLENVEGVERSRPLAWGASLSRILSRAAGAVPIDVRAMGIDLASCAMYKWLQGRARLRLYVHPRGSYRQGREADGTYRSCGVQLCAVVQDGCIESAPSLPTVSPMEFTLSSAARRQ